MFWTVFCFCFMSTSGTHLITFNFDLSDYWYQAKFGPFYFIDGTELAEKINITTMRVEKMIQHPWPINKIQNFPNLTEIYIHNYNATAMPRLINIPNIKQLSMYKNNLTQIGRGTIPYELEVLNLSSNQISSIENYSFGKRLKYLFLKCNLLTKLADSWFKSGQDVIHLDVSGNKITEIPRYMFKCFVNLRVLNLRNNGITTVGEGALSGPQRMDILQLSHNSIKEIRPDVLDTIYYNKTLDIIYFDLQYNQLTYLHPDFRDRVRVRDLKIWGNPWQCPCRDDILNWWHNTSDPYRSWINRFDRFTCKNQVDQDIHDYYYENYNPTIIQYCPN